jgi:hypothetical protein
VACLQDALLSFVFCIGRATVESRLLIETGLDGILHGLTGSRVKLECLCRASSDFGVFCPACNLAFSQSPMLVPHALNSADDLSMERTAAADHVRYVPA